MKKMLPVLFLLPLLCSCGANNAVETPSESSESVGIVLETAEAVMAETTEAEFSGTLEAVPSEDELSDAQPLDALDITPSDYFKAGVWTSSYTEDIGNFYIFDEDGIHGKLIPMADAEGVDFVYSINGDKMTMYVGEELTPYSAELEMIDEEHIIIHMTYLGTQDELEFMPGYSADSFSFYPAKKLAELAEKYYTEKTGTELMGAEYYIHEGELVVVNLYVADENGWRSDVESYTLSMFSAKGWSSITLEEIDLSAVEMTEDAAVSVDDNIQDIDEPLDFGGQGEFPEG